METEDRRAILLTGGIITVAILLGCARRKREPGPLDAGGGYPDDTYGTPSDPGGDYVPAAGGGTHGTPVPAPTPTGPGATRGGPGGSATPGPGTYAVTPEGGAGLTMSPSYYATGAQRPTMLYGQAAGQKTTSPRQSVMPTEPVATAQAPQAYVNWQLVEEDEEDEDTTYTPTFAQGLSST